MRFLAIDFGQKRTGLAVCDQDEMISSPLTVIEGQGGLIGRILEYIESQEIEALIVGLPLNMDGSEGPQAGKVRRFAGQLKENTNLPIYFYDERLSSFEADQKLAGTGLTRKKKKKRSDAIAAAEFLQAFLDSKHTD